MDFDKDIDMLFRFLFALILFSIYAVSFASEKKPVTIPTTMPAELLAVLNQQKMNQTFHLSNAKKSYSKEIKRVIYITLDGVRWQDIFEDRSHLKTFWDKYAKNMMIYGDPTTNEKMEVASVPISLPSYQSQMSGSVQPCQDNFCGQIRVETLPEYLIHHFRFKKQDVAIFASWFEIAFATEHQIGTTFSNAGNQFVYDPNTGVADPIMFFLNEQQDKYNADLVDRFDIFTFAQAMHYLEVYQPRFMWLSLTDADVAAHMHIRGLYNEVLNLYDRLLDILFSTLDSLGLSDETLVILTTDHGRGNGSHWPDHGPQFPESKQTWAFVKGGELVEISPHYHNTLSVRPTVEKIFNESLHRTT